VTLDTNAFTRTDPAGYLNQASGAQWSPGDTGYFGLSFNGGSGTVYGWVRLSYNANGTVTIMDFAYETSGAAILTGAGSAIPEPATTAALAALLTGSAALYRRRQQNKKSAAPAAA